MVQASVDKAPINGPSTPHYSILASQLPLQENWGDSCWTLSVCDWSLVPIALCGCKVALPNHTTEQLAQLRHSISLGIQSSLPN